MAATAKSKLALKAQSHSLKPVVQVGNKGITENLIAEIDHALLAHELIKIKIAGGDKEKLKAMAAKICEKTSAEFINQIGHVITIYRKNKD